MKNKKNDAELERLVLDQLAASSSAALSEARLADALRLRGRARKRFKPFLDSLTRRGLITRAAHNSYSLGRPEDLVIGVLDVARSGNGFVAPEDSAPDIFIAKSALNNSLSGDRVLVRLDKIPGPRTDWRKSGQIVRVLERSRRAIVGTLRRTRGVCRVIPLDPSYAEGFIVRDKKDAAPGDRVVIQFARWDDSRSAPEAEIIERIGPSDAPSLDTLAVLRHYGLSESMPAEVVREAESAPALMARPGKRADYRSLFTFTIDPTTARDFDDALSLETDEQGRRVLGVHIADVSYFVSEGSAMDAEAKKRGNSVYLPDLVLPMLPRQLSNGLCSLRPNEDRLAFSVMMTFDEKGKPLRSTFRRSVIRSKLRLSYEQALVALEKGTASGCPGVNELAISTIRGIHELAQQLRQRRFARFALDLDMPEYEVIMGDAGTIVEIRKRINDISHQLIEECMIAANEAVDKALSEKGLDQLRRVHAEPAESKIEALTSQLIEMGFRPGDLSNRQNLSVFLKSTRGHPFEYDARLAVLKSMPRAVYSPDQLGHYGLAKKFYAHFTSPIRRYPDLIAHRVLTAALAGKKSSYPRSVLVTLGAHCSKTEQTAENAEKMLLEIKKYRFLEQQIRSGRREEYEATIVKVKRFGFFVELPELGLQGLVPASSLPSRSVRFNEQNQTLLAGSAKYSVMDRVKVMASRVDFDERQIDFELSSDRARA